MKIFKDGAVYVQKRDVWFVAHNVKLAPFTIKNRATKLKRFYEKDFNPDEFIMFTAPLDLQYFFDQWYIINFEDYVNMDEKELIAVAKKLYDQKEDEIKENQKKMYPFSRGVQRITNEEAMNTYRYNSFFKLIDYKNQHAEYKMPRKLEKEISR